MHNVAAMISFYVSAHERLKVHRDSDWLLLIVWKANLRLLCQRHSSSERAPERSLWPLTSQEGWLCSSHVWKCESECATENSWRETTSVMLPNCPEAETAAWMWIHGAQWFSHKSLEIICRENSKANEQHGKSGEHGHADFYRLESHIHLLHLQLTDNTCFLWHLLKQVQLITLL